ncbi:hypothetical protein B9G39_10625 [Zooshikella ganghwensis]|uniref:Solute-binding protein family 3/N-terminal domain-containing protein n=2 Tax=Zooshikella ganghwensis TaxID=202772 RepID=A0A4V1INI6_9GAMM|nr:hypothetical protein B9G39_10625 [Zooshikella ganghwensis]
MAFRGLMLCYILLLPYSLAFATSPKPVLQLHLMSFNNDNHLYFHELLISSLKAINQSVSITIYPETPQTRIIKYLNEGRISLHWMLQTPTRDTLYTPIRVNLTGGLIGTRLLLIPKGKAYIYQNINSLGEFRQLPVVGALGKSWYDAEVWKANALNYNPLEGDWRQVYKPLALGNRGVDYFPRGVNEILNEAAEHPDLMIEPRLALIYHRDFIFYLAKPYISYKDVIEKALKKAERSGLQAKLLNKHWGHTTRTLKLNSRVHLYLETP